MSFNLSQTSTPSALSEDTTQTGPSPSIKLVDDTASERDFLIKLDADVVNLRDDAEADGTFIQLDLANKSMIFPTNTVAATPSVAFGDGDSGFSQTSDNVLRISLGGAHDYQINPSSIRALGVTSPTWDLLRETSSATNPVFSADNDNDTGIGFAGSDTLSLITAGASRIYIDASGNVGIGITNPSVFTHLIGDGGSAANSSTTDAALLISRDTSLNENIAIRMKSGGTGISGAVNPGQIVSAGNNAFEIYTNNINELVFGTNNAERMRIESNGNVGIGTTNPSSITHIKANTPGTVGSSPAGQLIIQALGTSNNSNAVITGYASDGAGDPNQQLWYFGSSSGSNENITALNRQNASFTLGTNGLTRLTILGDGKIGAGTGNPNSTFQIEGSFSTKRTGTAVSVNTANETIVGVTDTSIARTITLDTSDTVAGRIMIIKDESGAAGTNNITIDTEGAETIDGAATVVITVNFGVARVYSDGTNWFTF